MEDGILKLTDKKPLKKHFKKGRIFKIFKNKFIVGLTPFF